MIRLSERVTIPDEEILMQAVRAQGAGAQNVNKVSSAIHLFFNIHASSLPEFYKQRLFAHASHRISEGGIIVIKSQEHRKETTLGKETTPLEFRWGVKPLGAHAQLSSSTTSSCPSSTTP